MYLQLYTHIHIYISPYAILCIPHVERRVLKQMGWMAFRSGHPAHPPVMPTAGTELLGLNWSLSTEHHFEFLCLHRICLILNPAHSY